MPFTNSDPDEAQVEFPGLWIHDPTDPDGTLTNYLYGRSARGVGVDVVQEGNFYAGRTNPVVDYAEHENESFSVRIDVQRDTDIITQLETLQNFARLRRTLCFRDNRGRIFFGAMSGYREADQDWGTQVSFNVTQVDYDEGEEVTV